MRPKNRITNDLACAPCKYTEKSQESYGHKSHAGSQQPLPIVTVVAMDRLSSRGHDDRLPELYHGTPKATHHPLLQWSENDFLHFHPRNQLPNDCQQNSPVGLALPLRTQLRPKLKTQGKTEAAGLDSP